MLPESFQQIWALGWEPACWAAPEHKEWPDSHNFQAGQSFQGCRSCTPGRGAGRAGAGSSSQQPGSQLERALQGCAPENHSTAAWCPSLPAPRSGSAQGRAGQGCWWHRSSCSPTAGAQHSLSLGQAAREHLLQQCDVELFQ